MTAIINSDSKVVKRTSNSYNGEEWNKHRPLITRLYFEEGRTLKDVRAHLKQEFGFAPTERMYKSRLHRWGLDKKKKEHEMLELVRQGLSQKGADKDKVFMVRGRQVTLADALHYFNRKGIKDPTTLLDNNYDGEHDLSSPEDFDVKTPTSIRGDNVETRGPISDSDYDLPTSPDINQDGNNHILSQDLKTTDMAGPRLEALRQVLRIPTLDPLPPFRHISVEASIHEKQPDEIEAKYLEAIIAQAQSHYHSIFQAREITLTNPSKTGWSATSDESLADQFYYAMYHGYSFLWNDQKRTAFEHFNKACSMIDALLRDSHVGFLIYVLELIIRHDGTGYEEPLLMMLQQLAHLAELVFGNNKNPIFLIASWLGSAPPEVSKSWVALSTLRKLLDFFQDSIGYFHPETIALLQTFATGLLNKKQYDEAAVRFQQLVDAFSLTTSKDCYEACYALRSTAEAFFQDRKYKECLQALKMALASSQNLQRLEEREIHVRCLRAVAEIFHAIGQHTEAMATIQHVVDICVVTYGPDHAFTKRARMHQKSLRKGDTTSEVALPPMVYRLGRGGSAAKYIWTTRSSPTRLQG